MATLILPIGAGLLGTWMFGPTGGALAYTIVSALTAEKQEVAAPTVGDLRVQTSSYGQAIPFVVGKQRVAGNIIWAADKKVHKQKNKVGKGGGSSGSETVTLTYSISMAIALCKGPIVGITRAWADGKLITDGGKKLPGYVFYGGDDQNVSTDMQSLQGGAVPAYRGIAYIFLKDFDLGASGRVPMFSFEVLKAGL